VQIAHATLDTIRPTALAKRIRILDNLDPSASSVRADPARLQQVLWNLLSNAVKFTPDGGVVQLTMDRSDGHLRFAVTDNGKGIDAKFLPRVFERFAQGDATRSRQHGGLGLGLAIAKQLMELQGGSISAASDGKDRGAKFTVTLPLPEVANAPEVFAPAYPTWTADSAALEGSDLSGIKVLVVDDEPDALESLSRTLTDCGATVFAAQSAEAAIGLVQTKAPHVLISDIGMPEMDGYELLRRVRALDGIAAEVPAIALTAFARPSDRLHSLRAGYIAHLTKPADPLQLLATISAAAGRVDARV
jgi:CheY-like chemotaxis protein